MPIENLSFKRNHLQSFTASADKFPLSKYEKEGYEVFSRTLQCQAGNELVAHKKITTQDGSIIDLEVSKTNDNDILYSRTEFIGDSVISRIKNSNKSVIVEKKFDEKNGTFELVHQFEVIYDKTAQPYKIVHSQKNDVFPSFIEMTEYDLKDYGEDIDVIFAIKNGIVDGGKKISSIQFGKNSFFISESFAENDTVSKRLHFEEFDENGNIVKAKYLYQINNFFGDSILDINREFQKNQDGTTTTIVNNKKYVTSFDDENRVIFVQSDTGEVINIDVKKRYSQTNSLKLYEFLKDLPADLLIQLNNCDLRRIFIFNNPLDSAIAQCANGFGFEMILGDLNQEIFAHELGHIVDYSSFYNLLENEDIRNIYNAEWEIFKEKNPKVIEKEIKYFSQQSPAKGLYIPKRTCYEDGGLREVVAEVNMLTKFYGLNPSMSKRAKVLVQYFPNTIALIAKELEASTMI